MKKARIRSRLLWLIPTIILILLIIIYIGVSIYGGDTFNKVAQRFGKFDDTPTKYGISYQDVTFSSAATDKLTLRGWWLPLEDSNRTLVMVHGINQNRAEMLYLAKDLRALGFNLLYFDLRGHGDSDGNRRFYGQYESWDVVGAFNFVKSLGFSPDNIGISARSYGASSALLAMGHSSEIKSVFSDSAWGKFERVAEWRFSKDYGLPSFFLPGIYTAGNLMYGFKIEETAPETVLRTLKDRRIFLIHGDQDQEIPYQEFYSLKEAGGSNITGSWFLTGAKHCQSHDLYPQEYFQKLQQFFYTN
ncbi:alpha/beta hydrolase [Candidatus Chlorohelix sp.]|uniref:alpha/beta hydrolase n=1 Tax=Candidatus Chlorohelix sp. TaxID=3139201 RepID=UPI0030691132